MIRNISQASNAALADELGQIKAEKAALAEREKAVKLMLIARMGKAKAEIKHTFAGELFDVTFACYQRKSLDSKVIRQWFKAAGAAVPEIITNATRWTVEARSEQKAAA